MPVVRVRLALGRARMEFEGDQAFFERMIEPLVLHFARGRRGAAPAARKVVVPSAPPAPPEEAASQDREVSGPSYVPPSDNFGLFQRQLGEERNGPAGRIAAYAFFLWNYERKEVFREDEVAGCFRADGADVPPDTEALYEHLVQQRILVPGQEARTWRLTTKGKAHVRHHLLSA